MSKKTKKNKTLRPINAYTAEIIKTGERFKDSRGRLYVCSRNRGGTIVRLI